MKKITLRHEVRASLMDDTIEIAADAVVGMCVIRHIDGTGRTTTNVFTELTAQDWIMMYNGTYAEIRGYIIHKMNFDIAKNAPSDYIEAMMKGDDEVEAVVDGESYSVKEVTGADGVTFLSNTVVNPHAHVFADEVIDAVNLHKPVGIEMFAKLNNEQQVLGNGRIRLAKRK
jgi:hypothetical protein